MNKNLSETIMESVLNITEQWNKDNPDFPTLDIVQQLNYSSVLIHQEACRYESDFKGLLKGKTINDIH